MRAATEVKINLVIVTAQIIQCYHAHIEIIIIQWEQISYYDVDNTAAAQALMKAQTALSSSNYFLKHN